MQAIIAHLRSKSIQSKSTRGLFFNAHISNLPLQHVISITVSQLGTFSTSTILAMKSAICGGVKNCPCSHWQIKLSYISQIISFFSSWCSCINWIKSESIVTGIVLSFHVSSSLLYFSSLSFHLSDHCIAGFTFSTEIITISKNVVNAVFIDNHSHRLWYNPLSNGLLLLGVSFFITFIKL